MKLNLKHWNYILLRCPLSTRLESLKVVKELQQGDEIIGKTAGEWLERNWERTPRVLSKVIACRPISSAKKWCRSVACSYADAPTREDRLTSAITVAKKKKVERCSFEILHEICVLYTLYTVRMSLEQGISPIKSGEKSRRFVRAIAFDEPTNKHTPTRRTICQQDFYKHLNIIHTHDVYRLSFKENFEI